MRLVATGAGAGKGLSINTLCNVNLRMQADRSHQASLSDAHKRMSLLFALALVCPNLHAQASALVVANKLAETAILTYQVSSNRFPFRLTGELLWQRQDARYQARLGYSLLGQERRQTSSGLIGPVGLVPLRFTDYSGGKDLVVVFDQARQEAKLPKRAAVIALLVGAQDRLSVLLQLGALVASQTDAIKPGHSVSMQTIGASGDGVWRWTFLLHENLRLPGGTQATLKWVRQPMTPAGQQLEVWLAPALSYLPARIRITEPDGAYVDQQWRSGEPAAPS